MSVAYRIKKVVNYLTFNSPTKCGAMILLSNFCTKGWISFTDRASVYYSRIIA